MINTSKKKLRSAKRAIHAIFEKLTDTRIYRTAPRGVDIFADIKTHLPNLRVKMVFDVGASVGESAMEYLHGFPGAKIFCFEPVESTFKKLEANLKDHGNIRTFKLALSSEKRAGKMVLGSDDKMNFLATAVKGPQSDDSARQEEVMVETLDDFCRDQNIPRINFLKIDAEGSDLEALKGAEGMLGRHDIDVVEVEAGMNRKNKRQVPFQAFSQFFEERNYFLFGIYEQVYEWPTKEHHLRRANLLFISNKVIKANIG